MEKNIDDIIKERRALSKETKNFIKSNIFFDIVVFLFMFIIIFLVNFAFKNFEVEQFKNYIRGIQILLAFSVIIFFETSYKKDSLLISLYGIEMLVFSIFIMFSPYYMIFKGISNFANVILACFLIYYFSKSLITFIKIKSNYIRDNISDVKEIVKDDKKGYIDEKSTKTLRKRLNGGN